MRELLEDELKKKLLRAGDRLGALLSTACALHCLLLPLLLASMPAAASLEALELPVIIAGLMIGAVTLPAGYRVHRRKRVLLMFAVAAVLLLGGMFLEHTLEVGASVAGALLLAFAHRTNCRHCADCDALVPSSDVHENVRV